MLRRVTAAECRRDKARLRDESRVLEVDRPGVRQWQRNRLSTHSEHFEEILLLVMTQMSKHY